ncbi:MAG: N-acetylneuraminate synthase [Homavirus sp.]|uniref:N-acetylneuraminate synthase n=1 Tax=Homavirus sp. TaxID=2487769 RepID=A0A3G5A514_9VIRU|nr:MAG: N-acetylneuraminate synthase [Homavirus sp.]
MLRKTNIIAEIGINHNGDIELAKELIKLAKDTGCTYAKFQKRTPDICVPEHQKNIIRDTPWGKITYLEYKKKIEFNQQQLEELYQYANHIGINLFASVWDLDSVDLMAKFTNIGKIPSALITDLELCAYARKNFKTLIVSTGMSTQEEVDECIRTCNPDVIMHTNSTYPCPTEDLNLNYITFLKNKYPTKQIGYSGHELGLATTFATITLGAEWVERHVTLNKGMWGSDHNSSIGPQELYQLVSGIRDIELATQYRMGPRMLFQKENIKKQSLRK